jgi:hypothetical protein
MGFFSKNAGGLIGSLVGAGTGIFGMIKAAQAGKQLQEANQGVLNQQSDLANWYNDQSNKSFFDTASAQSGLARIRDQYKQNLAEVNNKGVQGGATDEAQIAAKTSLQDNYNNTLSNLVGYGTQYQNNMKRAYGGALQGLWQGNTATYMPQIQSWGNLANNGFNLLGKSASTLTGK